MLISRAQKKIVLKLRHPQSVTDVIPSARQFAYNGDQLVAVPHGIDEVRVLRNLGIMAPSPVAIHYRWPGQYKPFRAQRETTEFLTLNPKAFVLNDMGTGKTLATLWAWDYLREIAAAKGIRLRLLIVSPLSTLERTWADEVFRHFSHLSVGVLYGTKDRRQKVLAGDYDIFLINHDGMAVIEKELIARTDIDTVVVDEIATFRNASTGRWKTLNKVCAGRERLWGLTGTPTPNLPTDAWAQCRLISPEKVPRYYGKFRDSVMIQMGQFKWLPREGSTEIVAEAMQPAIRFSRAECVDLPPVLFQERQVALTPEQKAAYKEMVAKLQMEFQQQQVLAVNEAVKRSKLIQIACGVVYGPDGSEVLLPTEPRIAEVQDVIEQAQGKIIVFVPFKAVLRYVAGELESRLKLAVNAGGNLVEMISGDTTKSERDRIFGDFQDNPRGCRVLVASPAAMSHGLTLTAADTIIWYAPVDSHETYQQANARISRPGQKRNQLVVNIQATEVERRVYARLKNKENMQGLLLDAIR